MRNAPAFAGFLLASELAGIVGSLLTSSAIPTWYAGLSKPPLNPPSWVFAPVWTALYALMGTAAYLVWAARGKEGRRTALTLFWLQLALNAAWSPIFFGMRSPGTALVVLVAMWLAVVATIASFRKIEKTAAWLMLPYLAWISFAMYLNAGIWFLNR